MTEELPCASLHYLWQVPLQFDNSKLIARLGGEPHTLLDEAVGWTFNNIDFLLQQAQA